MSSWIVDSCNLVRLLPVRERLGLSGKNCYTCLGMCCLVNSKLKCFDQPVSDARTELTWPR